MLRLLKTPLLGVAIFVSLLGCADSKNTPAPSTAPMITDSGKSSADTSTTINTDEEPSEHVEDEKSAEEPTKDKNLAFEGDISDLGKEFAKDRDAARAKYDGKQVIISGAIRERYNDHRDRNYLVILGDNSDSNTWAHAHFAPGKGYDALNSLSGRHITLKAEFYRHAGVVGLDKTEVIELGPQPAELFATTADDFAQEFELDVDAGLEKFKQTPILVEGIVAAIEDNYVLLRGEDEKNPTYVVTQFSYHPNHGFHEIASLSEGIKIKILADARGTFADFHNVRTWYGDEFPEKNAKVVLINSRLWLDKDNDPLLKMKMSD